MNRPDRTDAHPGFTRRSLLTGTAASGLSILAGCLSARAGDPDEEAADESREQTDQNPIIRETSFASGSLVVRLRDGHDVDALRLLDADGQAVVDSSVATGETRVELPILDIEPESAEYTHYTPGEHTLLAESEGEVVTSIPLALQPELEIVDIAQYRGGDRASDLGKLAVTVRNVGTAPTWVFKIVYEDSPNFAANDVLGSNPGTSQFTVPANPDELIVEPNQEVTYVGLTNPLVLREDQTRDCSSELGEMSVVIGVASGERLIQRVSVTLGGESVPVGIFDEYTCTDIETEISSGVERA